MRTQSHQMAGGADTTFGPCSILPIVICSTTWRGLRRSFSSCFEMGVVAPNNNADAKEAASPADSPLGINLTVGISRWQPDPSQPERPKKADRIVAPKATSAHLPR